MDKKQGVTVYRKALKNSPIYYDNERTRAMKAAYTLLNEALDEYASKNKISSQEIEEYHAQLEKLYAQRRASNFIAYKLNRCNDYLNNALAFVLNKGFQEDATNVLYYSDKCHTIRHEQF